MPKDALRGIQYTWSTSSSIPLYLGSTHGYHYTLKGKDVKPSLGMIKVCEMIKIAYQVDLPVHPAVPRFDP